MASKNLNQEMSASDDNVAFKEALADHVLDPSYTMPNGEAPARLLGQLKWSLDKFESAGSGFEKIVRGYMVGLETEKISNMIRPLELEQVYISPSLEKPSEAISPDTAAKPAQLNLLDRMDMQEVIQNLDLMRTIERFQVGSKRELIESLIKEAEPELSAEQGWLASEGWEVNKKTTMPDSFLMVSNPDPELDGQIVGFKEDKAYTLEELRLVVDALTKLREEGTPALVATITTRDGTTMKAGAELDKIMNLVDLLRGNAGQEKIGFDQIVLLRFLTCEPNKNSSPADYKNALEEYDELLFQYGKLIEAFGFKHVIIEKLPFTRSEVEELARLEIKRELDTNDRVIATFDATKSDWESRSELETAGLFSQVGRLDGEDGETSLKVLKDQRLKELRLSTMQFSKGALKTLRKIVATPET